MENKSLDKLPAPDLKNQKITHSRKNDNKEGKKNKVRHLDDMLDKSFLKEYFEQKKDVDNIDEGNRN